jgi:TRAP transporter TAXI family solute receptor
MAVVLEQNKCAGLRRLVWLVSSAVLVWGSPVFAQETIDVGVTGFAVKRPVLASACPNGCPWGEIGDFVTEAMQPFGYEVIQCRNCNRALGPPLVSNASYPPELGIEDAAVGTNVRVNARVDFGITASSRLAWAYEGLYNYEADGPLDNLRLIGKVEDPSYLLMAVKADSNITDLSQVAEQKLPVRILGGGSPVSQPVLDHYGLTQEAVTSWGGVFDNPIFASFQDDPLFDIVITENASPTNNPESAYWTKITQKHNLRFLDFPESVLERLANDETLGLTRVVVKWGFLRGVDRPIKTVARSGHALFARDDMPEQAAYDAARALDIHREALRWYIRPYSYDSRTVWKNQSVPLHPGAERYYREAGYLPGSGPQHLVATGGGGCSMSGSRGPTDVPVLALALAVLFSWRRRAGNGGARGVERSER